MKRSEFTSVRRRASLLGGFLTLAAILYAVSFVVVKGVVAFGEHKFASGTKGTSVVPLDVYVDVVAIDPVRQSMDLRLDVASGPGLNGTRYRGPFGRDLELQISDGESEQDFRFGRSGPSSSRDFAAGVRGEVGRYPFDRYATRVVLSAHELSTNGGRTAIPLNVTVWEGLAAWVLSVAKESPAERRPELGLAFSLHRPAPLVFFACVLYGLMVTIAAIAIAIGALVFVGMRRVEATLVSAQAAMVFALPVMRNVLPGAPPLGVLADIFVFLWAEVAVAIGLTLVVTAWVRRGPQP